MNKLSISVYNKLIEQRATSREIDFVIYLARYQDAHGEVVGVYHKDVEEELGISRQTFYDLKNSLENKGIIKCVKRNHLDWDITLLDNEFLEKDAYKKGYFQLHRGMFHSEQFRNMRSGAKLLAMHFLRMNLINQCSFVKKVKDVYKDYCELLGVKVEAIRSYLKEIKVFFYINIKKRNYYFKLKTDAKIIPEKSPYTENRNFNKHMLDTAQRRNRIKTIYQQARESVEKYLNAHHSEIIRLKSNEGFVETVRESIEIINQGRPKSGRPLRVLRPDVVIKLMVEKLENANQEI